MNVTVIIAEKGGFKNYTCEGCTPFPAFGKFMNVLLVKTNQETKIKSSLEPNSIFLTPYSLN